MQGKNVFIFLLVFLLAPASASELVSRLCNSQLYSYGDPFSKNLELVLNDLVQSTPQHHAKDYTNISPRPVRFVYGHAQCPHASTAASCSSCLKDAVAALGEQCGNAFGGRVTMVDCFMRYEAYPFGAETTQSLSSA